MIETKEQIRQRIRQARRALSPAEVDAKSRAIVQKCIELIPWPQTKSIHLFLPIAKQNEVSTWTLLQWVWDSCPNTKTYVPIMDAATDRLSSARVDCNSQFSQENRAGIPQPINAVSVRELDLDTILIPHLAFDIHGHRLGYGRGHYDRFLSKHPLVKKIGLCWDLGFIEQDIPVDPWDVPLDQVITENNQYRFR